MLTLLRLSTQFVCTDRDCRHVPLRLRLSVLQLGCSLYSINFENSVAVLVYLESHVDLSALQRVVWNRLAREARHLVRWIAVPEVVRSGKLLAFLSDVETKLQHKDGGDSVSRSCQLDTPERGCSSRAAREPLHRSTLLRRALELASPECHRPELPSLPAVALGFFACGPLRTPAISTSSTRNAGSKLKLTASKQENCLSNQQEANERILWPRVCHQKRKGKSQSSNRICREKRLGFQASECQEGTAKCRLQFTDIKRSV